MKTQFSVVVTGFGANLNGPYGNRTSNPSSLIARTLPRSLPPSHPMNPTHITINIVDPIANNFDTITGDYSTVRRRFKELHAQFGDTVDLWIHLGRSPWFFVTCERKAFRQDFTSSWLGEDALKRYYNSPDNEQKTAHDLGPCPWMNVPMGLNTELDVNRVVLDANKSLDNAGMQHLEVRSHIEPAAAGCGFSFYENLANCYVSSRKRDVLFCHVPRHTDDEEIKKGRDAILAIIGASIASIIAREGRLSGDWKQDFGLEP